MHSPLIDRSIGGEEQDDIGDVLGLGVATEEFLESVDGVLPIVSRKSWRMGVRTGPGLWCGYGYGSRMGGKPGIGLRIQRPRGRGRT